MAIKAITPILNVSNIGDSFQWFSTFGWTPSFAWNESGLIENHQPENDAGPATFGAVVNGEVKLLLCLNAQGGRGRLPDGPDDEDTGGVWMTWWVETPQEVDHWYQLSQQQELTVSSIPEDKPWGIREFTLHHPDGHTFRVSCQSGARPEVSA